MLCTIVRGTDMSVKGRESQMSNCLCTFLKYVSLKSEMGCTYVL